LVNGAPESRLPVIPGWMPTPVAACVVEETFDVVELALSGSIGARLRPSSMSAPDPLAHHSVGLTPLPMNRNASRLGEAAAAVGWAPQTDTDSSHGSAITTPVPRRKRRRLT
jgi:hypothetical protein